MVDAIDTHLKSASLSPAALAVVLPSISYSYSQAARTRLLQCAAAHIEDISKHPAFLAWPAPVLQDVLRTDAHPLHAVPAAWLWVQHDADARTAAWVQQLLPEVRLCKLLAADMQALMQQVDDEALRRAIHNTLLERSLALERMPAPA
jgi:hypothetical protein